MKNVKMYTMKTCDHCRHAKEFLDKNNVQYEEIDTGTDSGYQALQAIGFNVVPILVIGDVTIRGFNPQKIEKALDAIKTESK